MRAVIDTNLVGYFMVARRFVPIMLKHGHGSLVYVSTSTNTMTRPGQLPYGPSKAGAEAMTTIIANEMKDMNIPFRGYRESGSMETVNPVLWKPSVRD